MSSVSKCILSSSAILLLYSPQRFYARALTLIGVLVTLAVGKWQWVMIYLVMELGSLKQQAAFAEAVLL
jgi:hypothetical protein